VKEDYQSIYRQMHADGLDRFAGLSLLPHVSSIAALVSKTGARSLLDYGAGKGAQYFERRAHEAWGGLMPALYDVGVPEFSQRPTGTFDGVICTDVLEHIAEPDLPEILDDIFSFAGKFVLFSVATRLAGKTLPDGRNAHLTVRAPLWWKALINSRKPRHDLIVERRFPK
jgi:hypothetical protein